MAGATPAPDSARTLTVTVQNTAPSGHHRRPTGIARRGGLGLAGLTDRVTTLGGTLDAGPHGDGGWRLTAVLPLTKQRKLEPR